MPDLARELYELTGTDVGLTQPGSLVLAFSEAEVAQIRSRRVPAYEASGEPMQWLSPEEVRRREPGVAPEVLGGLLLPESHNVYAPQYVKALAHGAGARGATLLEGTVVTGVRREGERVTAVETSAGTIPCGAVVLATGAWTGLASRWLGVALPVGPQRGQILALQSRPPQPPVRHILHGQGGYAIPKPNGTTVHRGHARPGGVRRPGDGGGAALADHAGPAPGAPPGGRLPAPRLVRLPPGDGRTAARRWWAGSRGRPTPTSAAGTGRWG